MNTLSILRDWFCNNNLSLNENNEVRLEETHQTLGLILESESAVVNHLRYLALEEGYEWDGVDTPDLYDSPQMIREGLHYLGENHLNIPVWYQRY
jgi:hypothetical protein